MTLLLVVDWSNRSKRTARKILQTRILVSWRFISAHKADCAPLPLTKRRRRRPSAAPRRRRRRRRCAYRNPSSVGGAEVDKCPTSGENAIDDAIMSTVTPDGGASGRGPQGRDAEQIGEKTG